MEKPKEEEEEKERPEGGYRHTESTAGSFCMLLTTMLANKGEGPAEGRTAHLTLFLVGTCLHRPWRGAGEI